MTNTRYEWNANARFKADAQVIGEELERIRQRDGGITVETMLEEAKPAEAPLHSLCTWDNQVAGEKWRKHELRQVPRSIRVITQDNDSRPAYVHIKPQTTDKPGYYQDVKIAVKNIDEYALAFQGLNQRISQAQVALNELERVAQSGSSQKDQERRALLAQVDQALAVASAALKQAA